MRVRVHRHQMAQASDPNALRNLLELETLRQVLRRELRKQGGQRTLAREIGVHRETLRKFAEGQSTPVDMHLEQIREWARDRPEIKIPLALVAVAILVDDLPPPQRPAARRRFAATLAKMYEENGEGIPTWVSDELRGLGREQE
jgi:hypothetical protein